MPVEELPNAYAVSLTDDQLDIFYQHAPTAGTQNIYTQHRAQPIDSFVNVDGDMITGLGNDNATKSAPSISADGSVLVFQLEGPPRLFRADERNGFAFGRVSTFGDNRNIDYDASMIDDNALVFARTIDSQADLYFMERSCN